MQTMTNTYRIKLLLLALAVAVNLTVQPIRQAKAIVPLVVGAGILVSESATGAAFLSSLALHATVLAIGVYAAASSSPPTSDAAKLVDVKLNPKTPLATPSGWTAPVAPAIEPTAPPTATATLSYSTPDLQSSTLTLSSSACAAGTKADCLAKQVAASYTQVSATNQTLAYGVASNQCTVTAGQKAACLWTNGNGIVLKDTNGTTYGATFTNVTVCPAGYTASGSNCNKSNEAAVIKPSDGKCQIKRVGNSVSYDTRDPDCANGVVPANVTLTTDTMTVASDDGFRSSTVKINADGTTTTTENVSRTDGSNKTDKLVTNFSAPDATTGAVQVTGFSSSTYSGTGTAVSSTPDAGTSDAKDATLQAIKASIDGENSKADADRTAAAAEQATQGSKLGALTDNVAALGLPAQSLFAGFTTTGISDHLPTSDGDCVTLDSVLPYMGTLTLNPCGVISQVSPIINWMVLMFGISSGLALLLGRKPEAEE